MLFRCFAAFIKPSYAEGPIEPMEYKVLVNWIGDLFLALIPSSSAITRIMGSTADHVNRSAAISCPAS